MIKYDVVQAVACVQDSFQILFRNIGGRFMLKDFKAMAELVKANPVKKRIVLCCAHDEHSLDAVYEALSQR